MASVERLQKGEGAERDESVPSLARTPVESLSPRMATTGAGEASRPTENEGSGQTFLPSTPVAGAFEVVST